MKPLPHSYRGRLTGGPSTYGELTAGRVPALRTAPPPQFDGPGDAWSPEEIFLAAIESCFLFTFQAVARSSKLEFVTLELDAEGTVDRDDRVVRFTEIILRAGLTVPAGTARARAIAALEKTKSACLVSASINTPIRLVAHVQDTQQPALPAAS
jgi:organic hydroperoxide reductase OsmC/OhrA